MDEVISKPEREVVFEEMVYCGTRMNSKNKIEYSWAMANNVKESFLFSKQIVTAGIGGVYKVYSPADNLNSVLTAGTYAPVYLRRYEDTDMVKIWALRDEATKEQQNLKSVLNKAAKVNPLDELIAEVSSLSSRLTPAERRALHAKISEAIFKLG